MDTFLGSPTIQDALSELLAAQRFTKMSEEVKTEADPARLRQYARIVLRNAPDHMKRRLRNAFLLANLI